MANNRLTAAAGVRATAHQACDMTTGVSKAAAMSNLPRVEIEYCTQCRWLLRAAWMAQELLISFEQEIGEVALRPGTGGVFEVRVDGASVWSRKAEGRFPDIKELKQRVRDRVAPDKPLGHSDRHS
jgi:selenoprotein W-related protein